MLVEKDGRPHPMAGGKRKQERGGDGARGTMNDDDGDDPRFVVVFGTAEFPLEAREDGRCAHCLDRMPEEHAGRVVCQYCARKFR